MIGLLGAIAVLAWWVIYLRAARSVRRLELFDRLRPRPPAEWPKLSVLIPACNEAKTLEPALVTLLAQDYANLEIVLIDDRSTDGTGEVVDRLAAMDPRITAVHVTELPEGWLGKLNALSTGLEGASGEWVLFTDADVHFDAKDALSRAVALAEERRLDHLALLPDARSESFFGRVAIDAFGVLFFESTRHFHPKDDPELAFIGVGAFNLVRRSKLDEAGGLEWLRMEVGDDMGLGLMIHRAGGRGAFLSAQSDLHVVWYESYPAMLGGMEKNMFAVAAGYSVPKMLLVIGAVLTLVFAPLLAWSWSFWLGASVIVPFSAYVLVAAKHLERNLWSLCLAPLGQLMMVPILLRSGAACVWNGGIEWRGTFYPIEALRAGQRVKIGLLGPEV